MERHISASCVRWYETLAPSQVSCAPWWHRGPCLQHLMAEMKSFGVCSLRGNADFCSKTSVLETGFINAKKMRLVPYLLRDRWWIHFSERYFIQSFNAMPLPSFKCLESFITSPLTHCLARLGIFSSFNLSCTSAVFNHPSWCQNVWCPLLWKTSLGLFCFVLFCVRVNCLGNVSGHLPRLMPGFLKSSLECLSGDAEENFWLTVYTTGLGNFWD